MDKRLFYMCVLASEEIRYDLLPLHMYFYDILGADMGFHYSIVKGGLESKYLYAMYNEYESQGYFTCNNDGYIEITINGSNYVNSSIISYIEMGIIEEVNYYRDLLTEELYIALVQSIYILNSYKSSKLDFAETLLRKRSEFYNLVKYYSGVDESGINCVLGIVYENNYMERTI